MTSTCRRSGLLLGAALAACPIVGDARAEPFSASGFVTREASGFVLDEPAYDAFLEEVLGAARPRFGGTGRTSGAAGMDVSLGFGWAPASPDASTWRRAMGEAAPDSLVPLTVAARKGLPGGFELGAQLVALSELDVASITLELRWAIVEGHPDLPDVGMRLDAGALLGNAETTIAHGGLELVLGREITIAGLFTISPYGGYAFRYGRTLERQLATFEGDEAEPFQTVLPGQNLFLHHGVVGLRVTSRPLAVAAEAHLGTTQGIQLSLGASF